MMIKEFCCQLTNMALGNMGRFPAKMLSSIISSSIIYHTYNIVYRLHIIV